MSKFNALVTKLREIFQIDRPDLDFGIYRIMNARAEQITRYLEHDLREKVTAALGSRAEGDLVGKLEKLRQDLEVVFTSSAFHPDGSIKEQAILATPLGKDYQSLHSKLLTQSSQLNAEPEAQVYSHLLTFFSRYYEKGDYISQRRYKGDTYAIPYSGEEVVLHWANKDQYYIKSGESFTNYTFRLADGRRVSFQLLAADTAKDNRKDNEENRLFALIPEDYSLTQTDDEGEEVTTSYQPIEETADGDLLLHFTYQGYPKSVKKKEKNAESLQRILSHDLLKGSWKDLHTRKPTEKNKDRTLLEYHLTTYTEKNSADYFIHKDLGRFLRNELDFYIKNEVMHLDDVQSAETFDAIRDTLRLIQTLREIALDLIRFLAQLEDFQKKLWLKKKFVTQTDYCLTLDRIPESLYAEIATNQDQREEWVQLYAIDEIEGEKGDLAKEETPAYTDPITVEFLKQNQHLVLDTAHFGEEFKAQLLEAIPNLDESLDGLVIHSENFQALSLLQERYREKVKCVYIDPPYNTGVGDFMYKDSYQHSSWLTALNGTTEGVLDLINKEGSFWCNLNDIEDWRFRAIAEQNFKSENYVTTVVTKCSTSSSFRTINAGPVDITDRILLFSKSKKNFSYLPQPVEKPVDLQHFSRFIENFEENPATWKFRSIKLEVLNELGFSCTTTREGMLEATKKLGNTASSVVEIACSNFAIENAHRVFETKTLQKPSAWLHDHIAESKQNPDAILVLERPNASAVILRGGRQFYFLGKSIAEVNGRKFVSEPASTLWTDIHTNNLKHEGSVDFPSGKKPLNLLKRILKMADDSDGDCTLDYFAGSGTTGHAVINLNREDGGKRKYILVEMGDHFDTVLRPRLKKVAYSANWKDGKPTNRDTGISHGFKYLRLESYEDVLNNLQLPAAESDLLATAMGQDYQLGYMLDVEARASLLSVADFQKPFHYQLNIASDSSGASEPRAIDLVETFNYLLGLTVEHYERNLSAGYAKVTGTLPTGEKALILWRDCDQIGYEELDALCQKWKLTPRQKDYDVVYLNGDHNLPSVLEELEKDGGTTRELRLRQIEPEFLARMFEEN